MILCSDWRPLQMLDTLRFTYFATRQQHSRTTEKLAVLVFTGKSKEALGSQLINRRNPFQTKMWRNIINCMRPTTWPKTTKTLIVIELLDAR